MARRGSPSITAEIAGIIKFLLPRYYQHQIAALLGVNQGRISEVKTGKIYRDVPPARDLPPGFAL